MSSSKRCMAKTWSKKWKKEAKRNFKSTWN
jgi:hypothetical protein